MRHTLTFLTCCALAAAPALASAQNYSEPSRGFFIERGNIVENTPSIDLQTGSLGTSGALRLALPNSELILNGGLNAGNPEAFAGLPPQFQFQQANEIALKFGLPELGLDGDMDMDWAVYGGLSYQDSDAQADSILNLVAGLAMTMTMDQIILNATPELVIADDARDDTYVNLGLGAYFNIPTTRIGQFQPGIEFLATSGDGESILAFGSRWLYNDRLTLDLTLAMLGNNDIISIPGFARLNFAF